MAKAKRSPSILIQCNESLAHRVDVRRTSEVESGRAATMIRVAPTSSRSRTLPKRQECMATGNNICDPCEVHAVAICGHEVAHALTGAQRLAPRQHVCVARNNLRHPCEVHARANEAAPASPGARSRIHRNVNRPPARVHVRVDRQVHTGGRAMRAEAEPLPGPPILANP